MSDPLQFGGPGKRDDDIMPNAKNAYEQRNDDAQSASTASEYREANERQRDRERRPVDPGRCRFGRYQDNCEFIECRKHHTDEEFQDKAHSDWAKYGF